MDRTPDLTTATMTKLSRKRIKYLASYLNLTIPEVIEQAAVEMQQKLGLSDPPALQSSGERKPNA